MQQVIYNGKIYVEPKHFVEAILIEDDRIAMIGTNEEVLMSASNARLLDCQGNTVIPGFNDAHMHLVNYAVGLTQVQLNDCRCVKDIIDKCKNFIKDHPDLVKEGLLGRGWNQDLFIEGKKEFDRFDLDQISTDIPIVLKRVCGHSLITNTKAIEMLNLTADSPQVDGGRFAIGADGIPSGFFAENACDLPFSLIKPVTVELKRELLLKAMEYAVSCGLTSVQSNDIHDFNDDQDLINAIIALYQEDKALLKYRFQVSFNDLESFTKTMKANAYKLPTNHDWLKLGPVKLFKDGSLGARTALVSAEYKDDPHNHGIEVMTDSEAMQYFDMASKHHVQVVTHVIGDKALESMLDVYTQKGDKKNPLRHALIHTQLSNAEQLQRIADNKIGVIYQPIFLNYDLHIVEDRVSAELAKTSYAFKTLHDLKGKIAYSTDCPVEDLNPFANIYCAVNRKDLNGYPLAGYQPQECVDVYTAIDAYTIGSAFMEFQENGKGRLQVGYKADLVIIDEDIFAIDPMKIKDIQPLLTMVDGLIVYRKEGII